jgi:PAS domain S-box-containing protein
VRAVAMGAGRLALIWNDITARKRTERDLVFRAEAIRREGDGVCVVRAATGAIAYANESFERMMGYEPGELEGRDSSELRWREATDKTSADAEGGRRMVRGRRKDGATIWTDLTINGFDDPDLGWCWVSVHRDVSAARDADHAGQLRRARLAEALRGLPLLAYNADRDLRCTLLFDNLIDPLRDDVPRSGDDSELFGPLLADHVTSLNRRVLVTGTSAHLDVPVGKEAKVTLWVDPLLGDDGEILGIVGRALADRDDVFEPEPRRSEAEHQTRRPRGVFSRLR